MSGDDVTLQVVMRNNMGERVTAADAVAEKAAEGLLEPSPEMSAELRQLLSRRGFDLGEQVALGFSITAPRETVTKWFGNERDDGTFSQSKIPPKLREGVDSIVRPEPIDFGPVSYL